VEPELDASFETAWRDGYAAVNAAFARAVVEEVERLPGARVFFQDYHLYLAPRLVRRRMPDVPLMQFVHVPWPEPDYWRVLPEPMRVAVHDGLLANDVVGFHTARWRTSFLRSCRDILGAGVDAERNVVRHAGGSTLVAARPIAVDPGAFERLAASEPVLAAERRLVERRPEQLILRVDRTDPSKNIVRGFHAFGLLLDDHPELHGRVRMLALLDPSRQDVPEYAEHLAAIQAAAREVNARHDGSEPPLEVRIEDDFPASVAAYKQYDVLLVNAVFDGLNLVAKEAPLVNERDGVLVLSENAGVHEELGEWAVTVNPFDVAGQARALHEALTMPAADRRRRLDGIRAHVREHDLASWLEGHLADLEAARTTIGP
jgi:trehalose 6-phosphate synthase